MSHQCHGWNRSVQGEALPPKASKAPSPWFPAVVWAPCFWGRIMDSIRGKGLCCLALLASVRLSAQARPLWGPGVGVPLERLHLLLAAHARPSCSAGPQAPAPAESHLKTALVQGRTQSWPTSGQPTQMLLPVSQGPAASGPGASQALAERDGRLLAGHAAAR